MLVLTWIGLEFQILKDLANVLVREYLPHMLLQAAPDACARHIAAAVGNLDWHER